MRQSLELKPLTTNGFKVNHMLQTQWLKLMLGYLICCRVWSWYSRSWCICLCVTPFEFDADGLGLFCFAQILHGVTDRCSRFGFALPHVSEFDSVAEFDGNRNAEQVSPPEQPVHPAASPPACGGTNHESRGWVLSFWTVTLVRLPPQPLVPYGWSDYRLLGRCTVLPSQSVHPIPTHPVPIPFRRGFWAAGHLSSFNQSEHHK